jgi:GNAT superfamily N-acetyltransferase
MDSQNEDFILQPIELPSDGPGILHLHYQSYLAGATLQPRSRDGPISESQYIATHLPYLLTHFNAPSVISSKVIPHPTPLNPSPALVGYIVLNPPTKLDKRTEEEKQRELREEVEGMGCDGEENKEVTLGIMREGKTSNERFLGKAYEARFWLLDALYVDTEFQRRGLGTRLVRWGLETAEEGRRTKKGKTVGENEAGEEERRETDVEVEGVYLISSPAGQKTYTKCGFEKVGERAISSVTGKREDMVFSWYVKRFS